MRPASVTGPSEDGDIGGDIGAALADESNAARFGRSDAVGEPLVVLDGEGSHDRRRPDRVA